MSLFLVYTIIWTFLSIITLSLISILAYQFNTWSLKQKIVGWNPGLRFWVSTKFFLISQSSNLSDPECADAARSWPQHVFSRRQLTHWWWHVQLYDGFWLSLPIRKLSHFLSDVIIHGDAVMDWMDQQRFMGQLAFLNFYHMYNTYYVSFYGMYPMGHCLKQMDLFIYHFIPI